MSWFNHSCEKNGHYYEPRYDNKFPEWMNRISKMRSDDSIDLNSIKEQVYVCDVCRYCGDIKQRRYES